MSDQPTEEGLFDWLIPNLTDGSLKGRQLASRINFLAKHRVLAAEKSMATLLHDPDFLVRERALIALIRYFRLDAYWEDARRMMIEDAPNTYTGASLLGEIKDNTNDPVTLGVLAQVVLDAEQSSVTRTAAFQAMYAVRAYNVVQQFLMEFSTNSFDDFAVDWDDIRACLVTPAVTAYNEEGLRQLEVEDLPEPEAYTLVMRTGIARYAPAIPTLARYLHHPSGRVRSAALLGLIRYLRVQRYFPVAVEMLMTDPDDDTRTIAARVLGEAYEDTQDRAMLHQLALVVADDHNAEGVRLAAYMAMLRIRKFNRDEWDGWFYTDDPMLYIDQAFLQEALAF